MNNIEVLQEIQQSLMNLSKSDQRKAKTLRHKAMFARDILGKYPEKAKKIAANALVVALDLPQSNPFVAHWRAVCKSVLK